MTRVLIAGGYGVVGSHIARSLRAAHPELQLTLAGRNPENAAALAAELGADLARLDMADPRAALAAAGEVDLVIAALRDPGFNLALASLEARAAYAGIADYEPLSMLAIASRRAGRPLMVLAYWMAGALTLAALEAAKAFAKVERIELAALYDYADPIGPMTAADSGAFFGVALARRGGEWVRLAPDAEGRTIAREDGPAFDARPMAVLDLGGLAAMTSAAEIRFDLGMGESLGTLFQKGASHDLYIDLAGSDEAGRRLRRRTVVSDPKGQAHLTALGAVLGAERLLGLDGGAPPGPGIAFPEDAVDPAYSVRRLRDFGVTIETTPLG